MENTGETVDDQGSGWFLVKKVFVDFLQVRENLSYVSQIDDT